MNERINDELIADDPALLIGWSIARDKYDNFPRQYSGKWSDLVDFVDTHRARAKGLLGLAGIFANDGRRCLVNALPRHFLPFDLDGEGGVTDGDLENAIRAFEGIESVAYETASSQPDARKARFLVNLSRPVNDEESRLLGAFIASLSGVSGWDESIYRLSQMAYLPPPQSRLIVLQGSPLPVDDLLLKIQKPKPKRQPRTQLRSTLDAHSFFIQNGLVLRESRHGYHVICPWAHEHSNGDRSGTAWFEPSAENGFAGGFKCLHAHCSSRSIGDIFALMRGQYEYHQ